MIMEGSDGFDLPRYVNSGPHTNYLYQQPAVEAQQPVPPPTVTRQHHRVSSILSESTSPQIHPQDSTAPSTVHRSVSLNNSFYSSSLGGYREDNPSYNNQEYSPYAPPRRAQTQRDAPGPLRATLSPKTESRSIHSPSISVTMDSNTYSQQPPMNQQQQQSQYAPSEYGQQLPPLDSSHHGSPTPTYASAPYPNHSSTTSHYNPPSENAYPTNSHHQQPPQPDRGSPLHASNSLRASASSPNTPMSYRTGQTHQAPSQYYQGALDPATAQQGPPPRRRPAGLRPIRDARDLRPIVNPQPAGRRLDPNGQSFLSPLKALSAQLSATYNICNPQFRYETSHNPRRVLTKPCKPVHNDGYDNEDYDYILYVNDWLGAEDGQNKYLILDVLGQGTFGQVVKCQNMKTHEIVAVKVVKNKPAYFNQSMMEVTILELLNGTWDPHDEHHILRLRDTFIHKSHLCLVFELLSSNLYELIKQNQFGGLSTQLVKVFTTQLLDSLTVLNEARLIHCDLKPENILLKSLQSPQIKVIDFGSACHERQTVYTYIQSRFYRSPEVLLGMAYTSAIDMWSLGCIAVELFLGLPLFPGTSEYNQITRIVEMLGMPPTYMLDIGKQTSNFFNSYLDEYGRKKYRLKSLEQYSKEHGTNEQPGKKYFSANTLPEIIRNAPIQKAGSKVTDVEKEVQARAAFIDFVNGLLNLNPIERWSPQQAKLHPFITGEKFTKPYVPVGTNGRNSAHPSQSSQGHGSPLPGADPKRPYGGLVAQPSKGSRAYQDAATYNQHLAQHQVYTAQAANAQAASNAYRNPYAAVASAVGSSQSNAGYPSSTSQQQQQPAPPGSYASSSSGYNPAPVPSLSNYTSASSTAFSGPTRSDSLTSASTAYSALASPNAPQPPLNAQHPHPPTTSYYPQSRARANTINQMDQLPPSLAKFASHHQFDLESAGGRNMTPIINHREEAMREWERNKHAGGASNAGSAKAYQQLEYLAQQAEGSSWNYGGGGGGGGPSHGPPPAAHLQNLSMGSTSHQTANRYAPAQPSSLQFQSPPVALVVDTHDKSLPGMRDVVMSSARSAAGLGPASATSRYDGANVPTPPQPAYSGAAPGGRYAPPANNGGGYQQTAQSAQSPAQPQGQQQQQQQQQQPLSVYDSFDARDGMGTLYVPLQPHQYQGYQNSPAGGGGGTLPSLGSPQAMAHGSPSASFYGSGVVPAGGSLAPIQSQQQQQQSPLSAKEIRRMSGMSGMDTWSR